MTPQTQLTLSKVFDEKNIRAMEMNGEIWVPMVDLADAWEVDRSTLTKIINRNPDVFKKLSTTIDLSSPNEILSNPETVNKSLRLVNERGMIVLGLKVTAGHIKNKAAKDKIIEFQLWVPELLQDLRKGLVQLTDPAPLPLPWQVKAPVDILKEELDVADELISRSGLTREQAHSYAVILAGEKAGRDFQCYATAIKAQTKQLQLVETIQPLDQGEFDRHFSLRKLAHHFGKTEDKIRNTLESTNIICFKNGIWHLTSHGESFGKPFKVVIGYPYQNKEVTWIRYNPACVDLLKKYFDVQVPV
jgi:prophage antirepressor-like protein